MTTRMDRLILANDAIKGRAITTAAYLLICLTLYHAVNAALAPRIDWFYTQLDAAIPWWPWTLPIYASMYLQCLTAAMLVSSHRYVRTLIALVMATLISCVIFSILPAHYPRPNPNDLPSAFWRDVFVQVYAGDGAGNTFPSIHVSATTLLARAMWSDKRRWLWVIWSVAIAISTLTVKQHFVADLLGGLVVALVCWKLSGFIVKRTTSSTHLDTDDARQDTSQGE